MAIVTLAELKDQLAFTDDMGTADDTLLEAKIDAAQAHIDRLLGFKVEETFGGVDQDPVPEPLREAVMQLAAWWYENRESAITGTIVATAPYSVSEIVAEYREFTF